MPTPSDSSYREIPLSRGLIAIIDEADFEWLNQWKWCAMRIRKSQKYYAVRSVWSNGKRYHVLMHRQILGLAKGDPRKGDHVEPTATLDNRRENLRIADAFQNQWNTRKKIQNTSGYKGVSKCPAGWTIAITTRSQGRIRKNFKYLWDAAQAQMLLAYLYHGEFARIS